MVVVVVCVPVAGLCFVGIDNELRERSGSTVAARSRPSSVQ